MVAHAWQGIIVALMSLSLFMGCASSPYVGTGAALGGGVGALSGAAIARSNPWAGAIVGGVLGSALGAGGGYLIQQRQQQQQYGPPQGYYPPQPGYGAPAPPPAYGQYAPAPGPSYGHQAPAPGPSYGYNAQAPAAPADPSTEWVLTPGTETPPGPGYDNGSAPQAAPQTYSQAP
jgi:hypothetical protein